MTIVGNKAKIDLLRENFSEISSIRWVREFRAPINATIDPETFAITPEILSLAGGTGSALGSGGMTTKLKAAQLATAAGIDMIIANGEDPEALYALLEGRNIGTRFMGRRDA